MDTVTLPSPLATVTDSLEHQPEVAADAVVGLYKYGETYVLGIAGARDCPSGGNKTCPYFDRIKIEENGTISSSRWAYFPVQKKWVELIGAGINLGFATADIIFDGTSWSAPSTDLDPQAQADATGPWLYKYGNGDVEYQLNLTASIVTGQEIDDVSGITYPAEAKSVTLAIEQKTGVIYSLTEGGGSSSSDDAEQYPNVAALRAAHTSAGTPLCLADYDERALIYFDETTHAVGFAYATTSCNSTIAATSRIKAVESGVITRGGRTLIAVQIPEATTLSLIPARQRQILGILGLASEGYAANGLAYFPGYTRTINGYYNHAAFKAWLDTMTTDAEAQNLP